VTVKNISNLAASVQARLQNHARATKRPFQELLQYYAMERFLYRLSTTPHRAHLVLKGALMLHVWEAPLARATKDVDFLVGPEAFEARGPILSFRPGIPLEAFETPIDTVPPHVKYPAIYEAAVNSAVMSDEAINTGGRALTTTQSSEPRRPTSPTVRFTHTFERLTEKLRCRIEGGDARHLQPSAAFFQRRAQVRVDDGVHHHARRAGDFLQRPVQLARGTHQGVDVFDRENIGETGANRPGHGVQGLAGGVRH
jgi:hypothetical protein